MLPDIDTSPLVHCLVVRHDVRDVTDRSTCHFLAFFLALSGRLREECGHAVQVALSRLLGGSTIGAVALGLLCLKELFEFAGVVSFN